MDKNLIVEVIVRIILLVVVTFLLPIVKGYIETHKEEKETKTAIMLADIVVKSIEQTCGLENTDKKMLATTRLKEFLNNKNIKLSDSLIDDLIESAVNILPHSK